MRRYKCRPADPHYWDDDYYVKEFEPPPYHPRPEAGAAEAFAEDHCHRKSEYRPMAVQVLLPEGWVTFNVEIHSVPEFVATRDKAAPAPETFVCPECDRPKLKTDRVPNDVICTSCDEKLQKEFGGEENDG